MEFTKAKAWAATIGSAATLLVTLIAQYAIEVPKWAEPIVQGAGLVATVYAVYKTRNEVVGGENAQDTPSV